MSDDIRNLLERLALVEGKTTPVSVRHGLNRQQQGVPQLPALFRPKNISPTLAKKPYQAHPMDGFMVGEDRPALEEAMQNVEEDMLSKVKRDFVDYLERLEDRAAKQVQKQQSGDNDLKDKAKHELATDDPTEDEVEEEEDGDSAAIIDPPENLKDLMANASTYAKIINPLGSVDEGAPVKTYAMEGGMALECWGNERDGFEIRRDGRALPSRFKNLDHADMAVKLYQRHRAKNNLDQDYIEER
jgi:hypothetical protein